MAKLRATASKYDLIRLGAYSQVEGNFRFHKKSGYRFTFFLQQIGDMEDLIHRLVYLEPTDAKRTFIQFYSKPLYEELTAMGFYRFNTNDWNIPKVIHQSDAYKVEYMRAVVDSLGNVDVDTYRNDNTPYVRISSINKNALQKLSQMFSGSYYEWRERSTLQWKGQAALDFLDRLNWQFNCMRNGRGAELIRHVKWERYIWA